MMDIYCLSCHLRPVKRYRATIPWPTKITPPNINWLLKWTNWQYSGQLGNAKNIGAIIYKALYQHKIFNNQNCAIEIPDRIKSSIIINFSKKRDNWKYQLFYCNFGHKNMSKFSLQWHHISTLSSNVTNKWTTTSTACSCWQHGAYQITALLSLYEGKYYGKCLHVIESTCNRW